MDSAATSGAQPAGWHRDPWGSPSWRYWDGTQWTHLTTPTAGRRVAHGPPPPIPVPGQQQGSDLAPASPSAAPKSSGLSRLFGRRTDAEKAAEVEYERLLGELSAGRTDPRTLSEMLRAAAESAGLSERRLAKLHEHTFRAVAQRALVDDRLSAQE